MAYAEERAARDGAADPDGAVPAHRRKLSGRAGGAGTILPQDFPGAPAIAMAGAVGHVVAIGRRMPLRRSSSLTTTAAAVLSAEVEGRCAERGSEEEYD